MLSSDGRSELLVARALDPSKFRLFRSRQAHDETLSGSPIPQSLWPHPAQHCTLTEEGSSRGTCGGGRDADGRRKRILHRRGGQKATGKTRRQGLCGSSPLAQTAVPRVCTRAAFLSAAPGRFPSFCTAWGASSPGASRLIADLQTVEVGWPRHRPGRAGPVRGRDRLGQAGSPVRAPARAAGLLAGLSHGPPPLAQDPRLPRMAAGSGGRGIGRWAASRPACIFGLSEGGTGGRG